MAASAPAAAVKEGLTDEQRSYVTELDKGHFTPRERAAIRFALNFAGDHHSIDEAQWDELRAVFDTQAIVELCFYCMTFVGTGRLATVIGLINAACALPGARLQHPK
jgi:alkylhydroperoxidase family enzyme